MTYPEPISLTATVSKGLPITGVSLTGTVEDPNGDITAIAMNDEGNDGDAVANDGIYSVIIGYSAGDGTYTVEVQVDNSAGTAQFTTGGFQPAHPSPDVNGEMPEAPTLPSITENFTRTATTQVIVEGTLADDHSDTPPGTAMDADNTDVAGAVDSADDVDFFQINNVDTSKDLVARLANLALGMDPVLTVYIADGTTEVASGSLADAGSANGYVYLVIEAADLDSSGTMVASVKHSDSTATQGAYEISAGSALVSDVPSSPTVTTASATSVTNNSATLNGTVNPNGTRTTYYFEYGTTTSYGSTTSSTDAGSVTTDVSVSADIAGLAPSTTYHFRLVATNSGGTTYGSDATFDTLSLPPTVTTRSATSVTLISATLNGTVNPNGVSTTYYFEYGTTTSYGSTTSSTDAGSVTTDVSVSAGIAGLAPSTTYHFRLVATNSGGTSYGDDAAFTTTTTPAPTPTGGGDGGGGCFISLINAN